MILFFYFTGCSQLTSINMYSTSEEISLGNRYAFQIEMKFKAYNLNYKLYEIPIIFTDRIRGESKLNLSIISEAIFGLIFMKLKYILSKFFK